MTSLSRGLGWHELGWGTGLGIASPLLLIYFLPRLWEQVDDRRFNWMEMVMGHSASSASSPCCYINARCSGFSLLLHYS
jgi:hypothetical protein